MDNQFFLRLSNNIFSTFFVGLLFIVMLSSCSSYRQNIMFKVPAGVALQKQMDAAEKNYVIQRNDFLTLSVYTNDGERIIDPDFKLMKDMPPQTGNMRGPDIRYLVNTEGMAKLPMIGEIKLEGLTLLKAEELLQKEYSKFYNNPFVVLQYNNKRVVVLGAPGGQIIPLLNQNVTLVEVLAAAKGINTDAKAHNIRVLRGDAVFVVDFSTFEGYKKSNMIMEPGDIVYVEPIRRPLVEGVRDYGPVISLVTGLATLLIVIVGI